jgi:hypothetical protein
LLVHEVGFHDLALAFGRRGGVAKGSVIGLGVTVKSRSTGVWDRPFRRDTLPCEENRTDAERERQGTDEPHHRVLVEPSLARCASSDVGERL